MRIALKLYASLTDRLPAAARACHRLDLDVSPGTTVMDVIRGQGIPEALCAIVLVDGVWVARPDRARRTLSEGEVVAIWPPVAGGGVNESESTPFRYSLDMCISREEFLRLLPAALGPFELDGSTLRGTSRGCRWAVSLTSLPHRRLGGMDLPLHRVDLTVDDAPAPEADALVERFRRGFLRGGG